jgi:LacI family transcriptional regulator
VMTVGVLNALEELGVRCPQDVALATFDDLTLDHAFHSHLTTVVQPSYEMGARAATLLMDRIERKLTGDPVIVRVVPTLVIRDSTPPYHPVTPDMNGRGKKR